MLLERLSIENYGVYSDRTTLDLSSTVEVPIVLIGGLNGAGKTTIFECVMIALYGKAYMGRRATKKDYAEFMVNRMHCHNGRRADRTSTEISFRFYHNGHEDKYTVCRSWASDRASPGIIEESLTVCKNGKPMEDVDESQWQAFIENLIPLGIARLFFFDGEKMVKITEWDGRGNDEIKSSLDTLLGADLINRLHSDLELYAVRKHDGKNSEESRQAYEQLNQEKKELVAEIDALAAERDRRRDEIIMMNSQIDAKEVQVSGMGGGYAEMRAELRAQRAVMEERIKAQKKDVQENLSGDAPLYLATYLLDRVKMQIKQDSELARQKAYAQYARKKVRDLKEHLQAAEFWPDGADAKPITTQILKKIDSVLAAPQENTAELFDISPKDADWIVHKIDGLEKGHESIRSKIAEYEKTILRFEKVESELAKIPRDDEIGAHISEIKSMHEESGKLKAELAHIEQAISTKQAYKKILQNRLKNTISSMHQHDSADRGVDLALRMQCVLDSYSASLKERKISDLESNLLDTARMLLHKSNMIRRIEIDRNTFEIRAYGAGDSLIPGGLMSMGERQIVGTALLWAIARTSGRSLPFVIDTPLGRLDGKHMTNLVDRFYPHASHQMILLSTDREIGHKEYKKLVKRVSRSYKLAHDDSRSATAVTNGYFAEDAVA